MKQQHPAVVLAAVASLLLLALGATAYGLFRMSWPGGVPIGTELAEVDAAQRVRACDGVLLVPVESAAASAEASCLETRGFAVVQLGDLPEHGVLDAPLLYGGHNAAAVAGERRSNPNHTGVIE